MSRTERHGLDKLERDVGREFIAMTESIFARAEDVAGDFTSVSAFGVDDVGVVTPAEKKGGNFGEQGCFLCHEFILLIELLKQVQMI